MSTTTVRNHKTKDDYMELIDRFPLRPIRTWEDYVRAGEIYSVLADCAEDGRITAGESDYLDMLTWMIRQYDEKHSSLLKNRQKMTPLEALKALMEETGMNSAALGKLLGSSGLASLILNGKRGLSKAHIRKLAAHFCVSPALFI